MCRKYEYVRNQFETKDCDFAKFSTHTKVFMVAVDYRKWQDVLGWHILENKAWL